MNCLIAVHISKKIGQINHYALLIVRKSNSTNGRTFAGIKNWMALCIVFRRRKRLLSDGSGDNFAVTKSYQNTRKYSNVA